jgi:hypothetical protein
MHNILEEEYMERREFLKNILVGGIGLGIGSAFGSTFKIPTKEQTKSTNIKPQIALTIDDGWFDREKIVNIVNYYQVPANFLS